MRLSEYTDYTLRVLMYCAAHRDRLVTIGELAEQHGLSKNHLMKVVNDLARQGLLETTRGRGGGLRLLAEPETIRIGDVVRATETDFRLVECFDAATNACTLTPELPAEAPLRRRAGGLFQGAGRRHAGGHDARPARPASDNSKVQSIAGGPQAACSGGRTDPAARNTPGPQRLKANRSNLTMALTLPGHSAPAVGFEVPAGNAGRLPRARAAPVRNPAAPGHPPADPWRGPPCARSRECCHALLRYSSAPPPRGRGAGPVSRPAGVHGWLRCGVPARADRVAVRDHRLLEQRWAALRQRCSPVAEGAASTLADADIPGFVRLYEQHIAREEAELLPMATRLLSDVELDRIGLAMRSRRGVVTVTAAIALQP
jgi:Rrf2 family nitric oxide-sensitive transcriptional repressor